MSTAKVKFAGALLVAAGVLAACGAVIPFEQTAAAAPVPSAPKVPKDLLEKRRNAAAVAYNGKVELYKEGIGSVSEPLRWAGHLLEAELALCNEKADQIAALKSHLKRIRYIERMVLAYVQAGGARRSDADAVDYERIDAEIRIVQAGGKVPPPPVYDEPVSIPRFIKPVKEQDEEERKAAQKRQGQARRRKQPPPQQNTKEAKTEADPKAWRRQRFEAARRVYEASLDEIVSDPLDQFHPNKIFGLSECLLEAELALSDRKEDRLAALKAHLDRAWKHERLLTEMGMDLVPRAEVYAARYERIGAEIRYFQATGEIPPPPPERKNGLGKPQGGFREGPDK